MKDLNNPCHHSVSEDVIYKEVVIIGNGPSGIITSFMLSGHVPYLRSAPPDVPIDEMLRARLDGSSGQSLYDVALTELAEGLEGRSQNPVPLLMDNLLNPCADLGLQVDSLVEWRHDVDKQMEHVVLGRGPPGGSWHAFDPSVRTLSPAGWLALPPHRSLPGCPREQRATAGQVADYYAQYVRTMGLQRYFHSGVVVTGVALQPGPPGEPCRAPSCPLAARWSVSGYDTVKGAPFRYACSRVVLASGASDRPSALPACGVSAHALLDMARAEEALARVRGRGHPVLVVGSGLSAADAVVAVRRAGLPAAHVYRRAASALAGLARPVYPEYCEVYQMMRDGTSGCYDNYAPLPEHSLLEVKLLEDTPPSGLPGADFDATVAPKRVKLLNPVTNETHEMTVSLIFILIGSKPDLHFLPGNFDPNYIEVSEGRETRREICAKCSQNDRYDNKHEAKRRMAENRECFLKNHWHYLKSVLGQGIQSCKSRYWDYSNDPEINGNSDAEVCILPDCRRRSERVRKSRKPGSEFDHDFIIQPENVRTQAETVTKVCKCQVTNPHSSGLGFGVDPSKPIDCRSNPLFVDKATHEVMNAPKGLYALGPLTSDNFVRFICGGALAAVAHMRRERKLETAE